MIKNFEYKKIKFRFINVWNNKWKNGFFIKTSKIKINEGSTSINYSQQCFEGIKCFFYKKKKYFVKVEKNSFRFQKSCRRILTPIIDIFNFVLIIKIVVFLNRKYVPSIKIGFLYIRPLLLGIGKNLGVKTSSKFFFTIFCCPIKCIEQNKVFSFTSNLEKTVKNLSNFKLGCNYINDINYSYYNKVKSFDEIIYSLNFYFEEASTSNLILIKNKKIISNFSNNILFGISKLNIFYLYKKKNVKIFKKKINFNLLNNSKCLITSGTAIFIKNFKSVLFNNKILNFKSNMFIKYIKILFSFLLKNLFIKKIISKGF